MLKNKHRDYTVKQILKSMGCKHYRSFPIFGDIDVSFYDCVLRSYAFLHYIIKRHNIVIVLCCGKTSRFCYYVYVGVL